jgi:hypothetical protein
VNDFVWSIRERVANYLVWLAHKVDDDVVIDIYRGK